jgi:hypothetical protein
MTKPKDARPNGTEIKIAYEKGAYQMCRLLLSSPRLNKPQREIIEDQALNAKGRLEDLGVEFDEQHDPRRFLAASSFPGIQPAEVFGHGR